MKKYWVTAVLFVCLALFSGMSDKSPSVFTPTVVERVLDHSLAVVTYFEAPPADVDKIIARLRLAGLAAQKLTSGDQICVAVIGAATLLRDGYAVTVAHLFQIKDEQGVSMKMIQAWILQRTTDHPVAVEVVAQTPSGGDNPFWNDYAVIRLKENLGLSGVKVAKEGLSRGDPVMFSGTVHGVAFFARFGFATFLQQFFRKDTAGGLHLSQWTSFPLVCTYPGGGGDSGGGVFNTAGELVGVMYCGIPIATETVIFSNPLAMLKEFLAANKLEN